MDNISMYLMVIASSTYANLGMKFISDQPSTATVGTIAETAGEYTAEFSQTQISTGSVGTIAEALANVTDLFESSSPSNVVVGTLIAGDTTITSLFEGDSDNALMQAGGETTSTLTATVTTLFEADDALETRSEMYRELTEEELNPPVETPAPSVDGYFASTTLLINGE